jgi:hypothetical protein
MVNSHLSIVPHLRGLRDEGCPMDANQTWSQVNSDKAAALCPSTAGSSLAHSPCVGTRREDSGLSREMYVRALATRMPLPATMDLAALRVVGRVQKCLYLYEIHERRCAPSQRQAGEVQKHRQLTHNIHVSALASRFFHVVKPLKTLTRPHSACITAVREHIFSLACLVRRRFCV